MCPNSPFGIVGFVMNRLKSIRLLIIRLNPITLVTSKNDLLTLITLLILTLITLLINLAIEQVLII
jgi:hypothetical protein